MKCPFCKKTLPDDSRFCPSCGTWVGNGAELSDKSGLDAVPYYPITQASSHIPEGGKKRGKGKWIAIGGSILAIALCGVAAGAVILNAKDPKERVIAAFEQAFSGDKKGLPSEELFGWFQFEELIKNQDVEQGLELYLRESTIYGTEELAGSGFQIQAKSSPSNRTAAADFRVNYSGMDLADIQLYYGDKRLMASVPQLSPYVFLLDLGNGLGSRMTHSPIIGPLLDDYGVDADELADYVDESLEEAYDTKKRPFNIEKLLARYQEVCKAKERFKEALIVEKAEKRPFTINKKEVKCQGYHTVVSKEAMIDFLEESSDFFLEDEVLKEDFLKTLERTAKLNQIMGNGISSTSPQIAIKKIYADAQETVDDLIKILDDSLDDVEMMIYLDKKGNLVAFSGTTNIYADGEEAEMEFEAELKSGNYPLQNLEATLGMTAYGERITINLERQGSFDKKTVTDEISLDVRFMGESAGADYKMSYETEDGELSAHLAVKAQRLTLLSLSLEGTIDELEKGTSIHMEIDELGIDSPFNGQHMAFRGEAYLKRLEDEIEEPSGSLFDVLEASEADWEELSEEIQQKAEPLFGDFY